MTTHATTPRTRRTFYADQPVSDHLDTIPDKLRSNWVNQACLAYLKAESSKATAGELSELHAWLKKRDKESLTITEGETLNMLDQFAKDRKKKK